MLDRVRADTRRLREWQTRSFPWYVIQSLLFENGYQAVVLHRIAHWFKRRRIPVVGPLAHRLSIWLTGVDISPAAEIGPGLVVAHGVGLVIGNGTRIGANAILMHGVTLGAPSLARIDEMPTLGDDVVVGAGATILGGVTVGDGSVIGAGVFLAEDVPPYSKVLPGGEPRIEPRRSGDEGVSAQR